MRLLWWAPLGLAAVAAALVGLRYGWIATQITETDVITHYAQKYLSDHGASARLEDCVARPGQSARGVWIVVSCQPEGVQGRYEYHVNRFGALSFGTRPMHASVLEPQT